MKHFAMSVVIGALLLLPACDTGGDGTLDSCATAMIGSLEGASDGAPSGPAAGWLRIAGDLSIVFSPEVAPGSDDEPEVIDRLSVTLDENGNIIDSSGQIRFQGGFDLDTCEGSGDWTAGSFTGTWVLRPYEVAY